jgi:hypothetical protein
VPDIAGLPLRLLVTGADFAQALSQFYGPAAHLQGRPEAFYRPFRGLVLHKELGIEQGCFDLAEVLGL